jgi:acetyl-CoA decarbonylase/synthase complex subunit gamma
MDEKVPGFLGWLSNGSGKVPRIGSRLTLADHLGACKARWGIGRMGYLVPAGLYAIGDPTPEEPVVVTANYKMSYDIVRSALAGRNVWLLVLETFGINVWCAAGKGTFGTDELVNRINGTGLANIVKHRRLILPILGAPGVAAHEVTGRTGFSIKYGTIRASDLPEYLDNGMVTTPLLGELTFSFYERLVLVPVEIVHALKSIILFGGLIFLTAALVNGLTLAIVAFLAFLGAVLTRLALTPVFLPWIPMRSFAAKGALAGVAWSVIIYLLEGGANWSLPVIIAVFLALPAISAFYALNFTGCTNFTSRSGVKKEMRISIPVMGAALLVSTLVFIAGRFL